MNYIALKVTPTPYNEDVADVLSALLAEVGFDSFDPQADCLMAYCPERLYDEAATQAVLADLPLPDVTCVSEAHPVEDVDWNETWEREAFAPIVVGDRCVIHAPGAEGLPTCDYDITLRPRMSFGSGYHETTAQMLTRLLGLDLKGKHVLDMGCGTGVLGILAALRGATDVQGIDIDEGACANALENAALNGVTLRVDFGDVAVLERAKAPYDVILANINRNILLADMAHYVAHLTAGGRLLMSGFYEEDFPTIQACAESLGLTLEDRGSRGGWVCCAFYNG